MRSQNVAGMIAEFKSPGELLQAAKKLRDAGLKKYDCHSPFPIHGMDEAMAEKRSVLGWIVGIIAFIGLAVGITLEWWTSTIDYPIVISGKPYFSYQAYGPVAFAVMVLSSAFAAVIFMLILNGLPRFNHPVFSSDRFAKVTTDGFFISIEADDPVFDTQKTKAFLEELGGKNIELLTNEEEGS